MVATVSGWWLMPAAELRTGPGRLNLPQFFPGNQVTLELTWPAGVLDGRSFTAHLGDEALGLSVEGDVMTITASSAVTGAVTETTDWVLDEVGGNALIVGVWVPDTSGVVAPRYETVVVTDTPQVTVQVASVGAPGGVVDAITEGDHVTIDASDPANPVVSVDGSDFDAAGSAAAVASDLADEVSARVAGDSALDGRLDAIEGLGPLATSAALDAAVSPLVADSRLAVVRPLFKQARADFAIWREDRLGVSAYWLARYIGRDRYDCYELKSVTSGTTATTAHSLVQHDIRRPLVAIDDSDASVTVSGTGWIGPTSDVATYGGTYRRNSTPGAYAEWISPASKIVGSRSPRLVNGGYALVTIDGDRTRANLLPTAQDEVNAGRLATTSLVANGGTLNPTDRLLDIYANPGGKDEIVMFAEDLAVTAHTVRLTVTGYKQVVSSDARLYISGFVYFVAGTTLATPGVARVPVARLLASPTSIYEYAIQPVPAGATTHDWVGNGHGHDSQTSLTITVDGSPQTLTDGAGLVGGSIVVTRVSTLFHYDTGTTPIGTATVTYTLAEDGLHIDWSIEWAVDGALGGHSYFGMLPLAAGVATKAANAGLAQSVAIGQLSNTFKADAESHAAWMWNPATGYAAMLYVADPGATVSGWLYTADVHLAVEDRSDGVTKIYLTRCDGVTREPFFKGQTWYGGTVLSVAYLPGLVDRLEP